MLTNNHFYRPMNNHRNIDTLLRSQDFPDTTEGSDIVYRYAESLAQIENSLVVVSDLKTNTSYIFHSKFSDSIGIKRHPHENSIWEKDILERMSITEQDDKYLAELRFFNFLQHKPMLRRQDFYLASHISLSDQRGKTVDVLHRMFYWYEDSSDVIRYGICTYSPMMLQLPAKSIVINSVTGEWIELSPDSDKNILSKREKQVLSLIESGVTSQDIADRLCISKHTVSRHRQEILAKLQAKNSTAAIRIAKQLNLL